MRFLIISIIFLTIPVLNAQTKQDSLLGVKFDRALELHANKEYEAAIDLWKDIVAKRPSKNGILYGSSFYNIPTVYRALGQLDSARTWYLKVLDSDSDLDDSDETGLLMEPHANYKHNSAMELANLAAIDSNYTQALRWIDEADTLYRYWGFEGSATNIGLVQRNILAYKVELLKLLDEPEKAIREIVIELIYAQNGGYFGQSQEELLILTAQTNFPDDFKTRVESLTISQLDDHNWTAQFVFQELDYEIKISNKYPDWGIPHYWKCYFIEKGKAPKKKAVVDYILSSEFFPQEDE